MKYDLTRATAFALIFLGASLASSLVCGANSRTAPSVVTQPNAWNNQAEKDTIARSDQRATVLNVRGEKHTEWLSSPVGFEPGQSYRLRFKASQTKEGTGDCLCAGTIFANYDLNRLQLEDVPRREYSLIFTVPEKISANDDALRFAQWNTTREYRVVSPEVTAVAPFYRKIESTTDASTFLPLGAGESVDDAGVYQFRTFQAYEWSNVDRPLYSVNTHFNTDRWMIGKDSGVTYRFALEPRRIVRESKDTTRTVLSEVPNIPFVSGGITVNLGYWAAGKAVVEASLNGNEWIRLGEIDRVNTVDYSLDSLINGAADEIFVRIYGEATEEGGSVSSQIHSLTASLQTRQDEQKYVGRGDTIYADFANDVDENASDFIPLFFDKEGVWGGVEKGDEVSFKSWDDVYCSDLDAEEDAKIYLGARVQCKRPITFVRQVFPYFKQNYTRGIAGAALRGDLSGKIEASWCEADYHVPRDPEICEIQPEERVELTAPKNAYESFQIVLRSKDQDLTGVSAELTGALRSEQGAVISPDSVQVRYAYYHYVDDPTDRTCAAGFYPDALIPMSAGSDGKGAPITVECGRNFDIWVTVKTPENAKPGKYSGSVKLTSNDGALEITVPFDVNVWDFALPRKNSVDTAYGSSPRNVWRYHNCESEADKRAIYEKYLALYDEYRMSIYTPAPLDPISVKWFPEANPPRCELDFSKFDKEMKRLFEKYSFTNFMLSVQGLGGGTFSERYEGSIEGYGAGTPQYDAMMTDYGRKLQNHLKELGLLDAAYVYCFDEPEEKDYDFVAGEFAKLKKYLPNVKRMLTEEPSPKFEKILKDSNAGIDIWCPVSNCYSHEMTQSQRGEGARFWWYVCTSPKEPYCTEFTDHHLQELRIWHWQGFERDILGFLIWETTYWTSPTLFVDDFQNPYLDPNCYQTGYGLPLRTKRSWGNGDGRFVYPPLTAQVPGLNDGKPIFDAPNASERLEMIRAGLQDYEQLLILKRLLAEKDGVISAEQKAKYAALLDFSEITTDATHFSKDPQVLLKRRLAVGDAIEELQSVR